MTEGRDPRQVGDRIERLVQDVRSMVSPPAWERVDELIRQLLDLYGTALRRIVSLCDDTASSADALRARLLQDELLASLLLLHGLHPDGFAARVQRALERVRPYLGSHGGGIDLLDADATTGVVRLRMAGSCDGCPSSSITIKLAVESAIKELAPEVTRIDVEGATARQEQGSAASPDPHVAAPATWLPLGDVHELESGELAVRDVDGSRIAVCRIGETLYAYRDACAACGATLEHGTLSGNVLTCACGQLYDARHAGRSLDRQDLHLDPLPLLQDASAVQVAVAGGLS